MAAAESALTLTDGGGVGGGGGWVGLRHRTRGSSKGGVICSTKGRAGLKAAGWRCVQRPRMQGCARITSGTQAPPGGSPVSCHSHQNRANQITGRLIKGKVVFCKSRKACRWWKMHTRPPRFARFYGEHLFFGSKMRYAPLLISVKVTSFYP